MLCPFSLRDIMDAGDVRCDRISSSCVWEDGRGRAKQMLFMGVCVEKRIEKQILRSILGRAKLAWCYGWNQKGDTRACMLSFLLACTYIRLDLGTDDDGTNGNDDNDDPFGVNLSICCDDV